jgi:GNAT superfamily N-acetyltransferase
MKREIIIRKATLEDIESLSVLFDRYRVFYHQISDIDSARDFLEARLKYGESVILVAIVKNAMVGFTQLYPMFSSVRLKRTYLLNDLFVNKDSRKLGIGSDLIRAAQQLVVDNGYGGLSLETAKGNAEGNSLYPQLGFVMDDKHNFYSWIPV